MPVAQGSAHSVGFKIGPSLSKERVYLLLLMGHSSLARATYTVRNQLDSEPGRGISGWLPLLLMGELGPDPDEQGPFHKLLNSTGSTPAAS